MFIRLILALFCLQGMGNAAENQYQDMNYRGLSVERPESPWDLLDSTQQRQYAHLKKEYTKHLKELRDDNIGFEWALVFPFGCLAAAIDKGTSVGEAVSCFFAAGLFEFFIYALYINRRHENFDLGARLYNIFGRLDYSNTVRLKVEKDLIKIKNQYSYF